MAKITKKTLMLTFKTVGGKEVNLSITNPSDELEATDVVASMNRIIAAGGYGDGDLVSEKLAAKYVMQQVEDVVLV